ncbi:MAG: phosphatase PAP2 family protein [Acidimicrobiales bacterium]|nr:phosphatase PAP2 family protein [Acidimicrobiales bacterium]
MAQIEDIDDRPIASADVALLQTPAPRLRWYREVITTVVFYLIYSAIRNEFGSNAVSPKEALANADRVIRVERFFGLYFEPGLQQYFLGWGSLFMRFWNLYYGSLHFVITGGVMVWLYRRHPARYPRWRTTLASMTGLALLGFSLFPLMPPRLLAAPGPYGGGDLRYAGQFIDTLANFPTLWSFNSDTMQSVSNQYAAMPSLHVGWSLWCTLAMLPLLRRRWTKVLYLAYVPATVFTIVVTANHYWIDAVGGVVVFSAGYLIAGQLEALKGGRLRAIVSRNAPGTPTSPSEDPFDDPVPVG